MDPIGIDLPGAGLRKIAMPHMVRSFGQLDALDLAAAFRLEQAELDALGALGVEREIDARSIPGSPERMGTAARYRARRDEGPRWSFHPATLSGNGCQEGNTM